MTTKKKTRERERANQGLEVVGWIHLRRPRWRCSSPQTSPKRVPQSPTLCPTTSSPSLLPFLSSWRTLSISFPLLEDSGPSPHIWQSFWREEFIYMSLSHINSHPIGGREEREGDRGQREWIPTHVSYRHGRHHLAAISCQCPRVAK